MKEILVWVNDDYKSIGLEFVFSMKHKMKKSNSDEGIIVTKIKPSGSTSTIAEHEGIHIVDKKKFQKMMEKVI